MHGTRQRKCGAGRWFALCLMIGWLATSGLAQDRDLVERREWAADLVGGLAPEDLEQALAGVVDPDVVLRRRLIDYLGKVELQGEAARARLSALSERALTDGDPGLRAEALRALAAIGDTQAVQELIRLLARVAAEEREEIARLLTAEFVLHSAEARAALDRLMIDAFREGGVARPADVLAILLPSYGKRLAERITEGTTARDRAPLVLGRRHASPAVRRAAELALEISLNRLRELERYTEAEQLLERFAEDGVASRPLLFLRAVGMLHEGGGSPADALEVARRLNRSVGEVTSYADERWRARGALIEANALIALDRNEQAEEPLQRAADLFKGLLARRLDRAGEQGALWHRDLLIDSALVEFTEVFRRVASGELGDDPALLARLRKSHIWLLKADLLATEADLPTAMGFDVLFAEMTSPYRCVFAIRPHPAWPAERMLKMQSILGRALASISAREMPGFEPYAEVRAEAADPLADRTRKALLDATAQARMGALQREINELSLRRMKLIEVDPALEQEWNMLSFAIRRMSTELRDKSLEERFYDLRRPSTFALLFAEVLRREDRNLESRQVAERLFDAIEQRELRQQFAWAVQLAAQAKLSMGGSYSDLNEPARAEELMQEGLEFFEGLQSFYEERGLTAAARSVDDDIAEALVSLAVNANVKAQDPKRAAEFFERAYTLRQDDFMRVLLACYRARSGEREKALALLEGVPDSPRGYYNLACTNALLGETQQALEWLEKDFSVNRTSAAALEKQKAWAREDPDLSNLRGDPGFELLTAANPVSDSK